MVQPDNLMSMHQPQTHTQKKNKKKKPTIFHILISLSSIIWILNMTQVISPAFHHPTPKYRLGRNIFSLLKASTSTLNRRSLPRPHNQLIGNSVLPLSWLAGLAPHIDERLIICMVSLWFPLNPPGRISRLFSATTSNLTEFYKHLQLF